VTWLGAVEKLKWNYMMLENVRKCNEAAFRGGDITYILHSRLVLLAPKDLLQPIVVVL
jgi:hypothetical protein